jgi:hypothetical protein
MLPENDVDLHACLKIIAVIYTPEFRDGFLDSFLEISTMREFLEAFLSFHRPERLNIHEKHRSVESDARELI